MRAQLARVQEHNATAIGAVAELLLERVVRGDGVALVAGSGHSVGAIAEAFFRAGGLATVKPLYSPELFPLHGAAASTAAERRSGLAAEILAKSDPAAGDVLFVYSTSGVNPYPVELAREARRLAIPVVAVTSRACSAVAPKRAGGTLAEEADHVLDTLIPPGDAGYPPQAPVTAPTSSLVNVYLWNLLLAELHGRAGSAGLDLPLWRSANIEGGDDANAGLFAHYRPRIPELE